MAKVKSLPMRKLTDRVLDWAKTLDHPRKGVVGNLLRLNLLAREQAKEVIVGLELQGRAALAAKVEAALDALRNEAGSFDGVCAEYGKVKGLPGTRAGLRRRAKALAGLLRKIERELKT